MNTFSDDIDGGASRRPRGGDLSPTVGIRAGAGHPGHLARTETVRDEKLTARHRLELPFTFAPSSAA